MYAGGAAAEQRRRFLGKSFPEVLSELRARHPHRSPEVIQLIAQARPQTRPEAFDVLTPPNPDFRRLISAIRVDLMFDICPFGPC